MTLDYSENLIRVKYTVLGSDSGKKHNAKKTWYTVHVLLYVYMFNVHVGMQKSWIKMKNIIKLSFISNTFLKYKPYKTKLNFIMFSTGS